MSFDKATFNSIYEDLILNGNGEIGSAQSADDLLQLGFLLGQSSIGLKHSSDTTCAIHEENLENYRKLVHDNQSKMLYNSEGICRDFYLDAKEFEKYLQPPCRDRFLDCENDKLTKEDIDALFLNTDTQSGPPRNKRALTDSSPANEPAKKFVFHQSNVAPVNRVPDQPTLSSRTSADLVRISDEARRPLANPVIPNEQRDAIRATGQPLFTSHHSVMQQQNDRNFQPSSSNAASLFAYDRTRKSNESDTSRDRNGFITGSAELLRQQAEKAGHSSNAQSATPLFAYGKSTKTLGTRRSVHSKFVPPITPINEEQSNENSAGNNDIDPRLKNIEPKMIDLIHNEIMHQSSSTDWDDIAGLEYAKRTIQEAVIYPLLRPDIFTGLRGPPRGILLFGPPGTGKTLIGRCIASKSRSTFFSISASSLTSKWIGEGEKMVRALFAVASVKQPSVIFIDEIDSLLSQRSDTEHESSRRLKTEFLVQLDGARTTEDERVLIVGATNRPQELDEAARRRLTKRLYIPLPDLYARVQILTLLLQKVANEITVLEITEIGRLTDGFSGADMKTLCHEALMGPIRSIRIEDMVTIDVKDVRHVNFEDFTNALKRVRASVSQDDLVQYEKWDSTYGLGAAVK